MNIGTSAIVAALALFGSSAQAAPDNSKVELQIPGRYQQFGVFDINYPSSSWESHEGAGVADLYEYAWFKPHNDGDEVRFVVGLFRTAYAFDAIPTAVEAAEHYKNKYKANHFAKSEPAIETTTVGGRAARRLVFDALDLKGRRSRMAYDLVLVGPNLFALIYAAPPEQFERYRPAVDRMLSSFKFVDDGRNQFNALIPPETPQQRINEGVHDLGLKYLRLKKYAEALKWIGQAAEHGDARAQFDLGLIYFKGDGLKKDYAAAANWFRQAAAQGECAAYLNLGGMYYSGMGVSRDPVEAYKWFLLASARGMPEARDNMQKMSLTPEEHAEAKKRAELADAAHTPKTTLGSP